MSKERGMVQFPLRLVDGGTVNVVVDGIYTKADLVKMFWSLAAGAIDLQTYENPRDVMWGVLGALEGSAKKAAEPAAEETPKPEGKDEGSDS
jgi:hypothetical protein